MWCFKLHPDLNILRRHGYDNVPNVESNEEADGGLTTILNVDPIGATDDYKTQGDFERKFDRVIKRHNLLEHRDTLLFIILLEDEKIYNELPARRSIDRSKKVLKEVASLIKLIRQAKPELPISLTLTSTYGKVEIKNEHIIRWIGDAMQSAITDFNLTHLHNEGIVYSIPSIIDGNPLGGGTLNYEAIERAAMKPISTDHGIRTRLLAQFLNKLLMVGRDEAFEVFSVHKGIGKEVACFLYDVGLLLLWIDDSKTRNDRQKSNYISSMFARHIKLVDQLPPHPF